MVFLHVATNKPCQGYDAVADAYRDVGRIYVGVPPEFILNVAPDVAVGPRGKYSISAFWEPDRRPDLGVRKTP
jgi:hypothetical protein